MKSPRGVEEVLEGSGEVLKGPEGCGGGFGGIWKSVVKLSGFGGV